MTKGGSLNNFFDLFGSVFLVNAKKMLLQDVIEQAQQFESIEISAGGVLFIVL